MKLRNYEGFKNIANISNKNGWFDVYYLYFILQFCQYFQWWRKNDVCLEFWKNSTLQVFFTIKMWLGKDRKHHSHQSSYTYACTSRCGKHDIHINHPWKQFDHTFSRTCPVWNIPNWFSFERVHKCCRISCMYQIVGPKLTNYKANL